MSFVGLRRGMGYLLSGPAASGGPATGRPLAASEAFETPAGVPCTLAVAEESSALRSGSRESRMHIRRGFAIQGPLDAGCAQGAPRRPIAEKPSLDAPGQTGAGGESAAG